MKALIIILIAVLIFSIWSFTNINLGNKIQSPFNIDFNNIQFDFWRDLWSGFLGGCLLALLLYVISEILIPDVDLTGEWLMETYSIAASQYQGYRVFYKLLLIQNGKELHGYAERQYEIQSDNTVLDYVSDSNRKKYATMEIEGTYTKNYLKKSKVNILIKLTGTERESFGISTFKYNNKNKLEGKLSLSAASSVGTVRLTRNRFFDKLYV